LTIDPARRLAESMGIAEMTTEAQPISRDALRAAGVPEHGSLTVMMLDTKSTFDDLIVKHANPEARQRILGNKLYQHISTSLAGTQEYMAMEKLYAIKGDPRWDLIVVDTPPTANALDFLDAPERMISALDSAVLRWLVGALESSGKLSVNLIARGAAAVLRGLSRLTGQGFLEALAELVVLLNEMFGGFRARANEVQKALRGTDVAYVLVTSPDPMSLREIMYFADRLREQRMPRDALVVNRVHVSLAPRPSEDEVDAALAHQEIQLGASGAARVLAAYDDERRLADLDRAHLKVLSALELAGDRPVRIDVPAFAGDVHDLAALARVADVLVAPSHAATADTRAT
jgi:anion-transporting  ArsA/GET3 family ATPase